MQDDQIQFEEEEKQSVLYSHIEPSSKAPKIVQFMIDKGWVQDKGAANYALLGAVVVIVIVSIILFITGSGGGGEFVDVNDPSI